MKTKVANGTKMIDFKYRIELVMSVLTDSSEGFSHLFDEDNTVWILYKEDRIGFSENTVLNSSSLAIIMEVLEYFADGET